MLNALDTLWTRFLQRLYNAINEIFISIFRIYTQTHLEWCAWDLAKNVRKNKEQGRVTLLILDKRLDLLILNYSVRKLNVFLTAHRKEIERLTKCLSSMNPRQSSSVSSFTFFFFPSDGQSDVEVDLIAKKYVERGSSVTLICKHNVEPEKLYKVTWLKGNGKVFEYINGRQPPYRNFSVPGAEIDVRQFETAVSM